MFRLKFLLLPVAGALSAFLSFLIASPWTKTLNRPELKPGDPLANFTYGTAWSYVQHSVFGLLLCGSFCFILEVGRRTPKQLLKATILGAVFGLIMNSIADSGADYIGIMASKGGGSEAGASIGQLAGFFAWFLFVPAALSFTITFAIGPTQQRIGRATYATILAAVLTFITRCGTTIFATAKAGIEGSTQGTPGSKMVAAIPIFLMDAIAIGIVLGLAMYMSDRSRRAGSLRLIYGRKEHQDWSLDHAANRIGTAEVEIPIRGFNGVEPVHACIFRQGNQFLLDCQHAPGFLNGQPVLQANLNNGDTIQLGEAQLVFYSQGRVQSNFQPQFYPQVQQPVQPQFIPQAPQMPIDQAAMPQVPMAQPPVPQVALPGYSPAPTIPQATTGQVMPSSVLIDPSGMHYPLQFGVNSVGRELGNIVCLSSVSTVSRQHAQITIDQFGATLVDMGSANGTKVNDSPLTGPTLLNNNDSVSFGSATLTFRNS